MSLREYFEHYHIHLSLSQERLFIHFLKLFQEYNSHTNLSAIRDYDGIIEKHCVDSLASLPIIQKFLSNWNEHASLLDIGSWGWFPWIPLKIMMPELHVTLLDSVGKKVRAMNSFIQDLDLKDIHTVLGRAEILWHSEGHHRRYNIIVSRATAYATKLLPWCLPFLAPHGMILLYKIPSREEARDIELIYKTLHLYEKNTLVYKIAWSNRYIYQIESIL